MGLGGGICGEVEEEDGNGSWSSSGTSPRMLVTASFSAPVMSLQSASVRPSLRRRDCHWVRRVRKDFSWMSLVMPALAASSALAVAARILCSVAFRLPVEDFTKLCHNERTRLLEGE
jgi:hypothetical protein